MHHDSYPIVRVNSVPGYPAAVEQDELGDLQRLINADIYDESSRTAAGFAANPPPTPAPRPAPADSLQYSNKTRYPIHVCVSWDRRFV